MVSQNGDLPLAEVPKKEGSETTLQALVREGLAQLDQRDYEKASRLFNAALKLDVTNADLHFLNALTYHLMGVDGDSTKYELAEQGLTRALKFDPSHYSARYQLGLLYMDERRYRLAEVMFASAALNHWDNPDVIYNLAAAAYYARDPRTAEAALMRLGEITPDLASRPLVLRATAISAAAVNDNHAAEARLAAYRASVGNSASAAEAARRVASWNAFYREDAQYCWHSQPPMSEAAISRIPITGEEPAAAVPHSTTVTRFTEHRIILTGHRINCQIPWEPR